MNLFWAELNGLISIHSYPILNDLVQPNINRLSDSGLALERGLCDGRRDSLSVSDPDSTQKFCILIILI